MWSGRGVIVKPSVVIYKPAFNPRPYTPNATRCTETQTKTHRTLNFKAPTCPRPTVTCDRGTQQPGCACGNTCDAYDTPTPITIMVGKGFVTMRVVATLTVSVGRFRKYVPQWLSGGHTWAPWPNG